MPEKITVATPISLASPVATVATFARMTPTEADKGAGQPAETIDHNRRSDGLDWGIIEQALCDLRDASTLGAIRNGKLRPVAMILPRVRMLAARAGRRGKSWEFARRKVAVTLGKRDTQAALRSCGADNDRALAVLERVARMAFRNHHKVPAHIRTGTELRIEDVVGLLEFFESSGFEALCNSAGLNPGAVRSRAMRAARRR